MLTGRPFTAPRAEGISRATLGGLRGNVPGGPQLPAMGRGRGGFQVWLKFECLFRLARNRFLLTKTELRETGSAKKVLYIRKYSV